MRFLERRRTRPIIPLVSLIDILTILLIFFIVTSEFREEQQRKEEQEQRERRLEIALPGVEEMEGQPVTDRRTAISLTADGSILLGGEAVADPAALVDALRRQREADPAARFELEPDQKTPLGLLVQVWDALAKAGIAAGEVPARVLKQGAP